MNEDNIILSDELYELIGCSICTVCCGEEPQCNECRGGGE